MSETGYPESAYAESERAKGMFKQTGKLPPSDEGDTLLASRHRTGELKEVGTNAHWHRIVTIATNPSEHDQPAPQTDPDLSAKFPLADEMTVADRTFAHDLTRYTELRRKEREEAWKAKEQVLKAQAVARHQGIQYAHETRQKQELNEWQAKVMNNKDFRKALGDPTIPESEILAMAAQMPESAVVDYVQRTGDIELLARDERMSQEDILGVIENMQNELPKEE